MCKSKTKKNKIKNVQYKSEIKTKIKINYKTKTTLTQRGPSTKKHGALVRGTIAVLLWSIICCEGINNSCVIPEHSIDLVATKQ